MNSIVIRVISVLILTLSLLLTACGDTPSGPPGFNDINSSDNEIGDHACRSMSSQMTLKSAYEQVQSIRRNAESHLHKMNDQIAGFGGMYIDEVGRMVVYIQDTSEAVHAKNIVSRHMRSKINRSSVSDEIIIKTGEYSFQELAVWRELATAFLLASSHFHYVHATHVHEEVNRIAIGIDASYWSDENLKDVTSFMTTTLEIPQNAIVFEKEFIEDEEEEDIFQTLGGDTFERQRPILGGLRIRYGSSNCSMGFLGVFDGDEVFVTNGHCTENAHRRSGTLYYQGERGEPNDVVGMEIADGPQTLEMCVTPNSDCWSCRWSDSAIVSIREDVEHSRGYIAKTEWKSETWMVEGSRQIDQEDPVFTIVDLQDDILSGMTLHKVGGNSGWTSGVVIRTCVDSRRSRHELILQCQYRARYASSGGGTSGSPVFKHSESEYEGIDNPITLVGIHWASSNRDRANGYTVFSPIDGVLKDFEELEGLAIEIFAND
jgi:hypothetical protein